MFDRRFVESLGIPVTGARPTEDATVRGVLSAYLAVALRQQCGLRLVLAVLITLSILVKSPVHPVLSLSIAGAYCAVSLALFVAALRDRLPSIWLTPLVDLAALSALVLSTGVITARRWTSPFLAEQLYVLVPVLAAFQLNPRITAAATAAATLTFGAVAWSDLHSTEKVRIILVHSALLAFVGFACTALSRIQQSRVITIGTLATEIKRLLAQVMSVEDRERRRLSEFLHDGPLQGVLAARLDIEEAAADFEAARLDALRRADGALDEASRQLRLTVTELHPEVLERAGLEKALRDLAARSGDRAAFTTRVTCAVPTLGRELDRILYHCARELLANVVKHAGATRVDVNLIVERDQARLEVLDDGVGIPAGAVRHSVENGHIGLGSQQIRLEEAGGRLTLDRRDPRGTAAVATLPLRPTGSL
ncbi:sensor histidine kinase [Streptomyces sp. NPDC090021]|uniref:sensor histidine kinase n=1 Tax=Streptomyces sp. NPDC090021 TaxID=3365919 RepID=UPI0038154931